MSNALIDISLRNRFLVQVCFDLLGGWGYWALQTTPIDAIPDLSDNQVIVFTDLPGHSPQEVTVLLNVRGRAVESFVDEARKVVGDTVSLRRDPRSSEVTNMRTRCAPSAGSSSSCR